MMSTKSQNDQCLIRVSFLKISVRSAGFTLIEVLIAIIILSVGLVMVVEAMGRTQHGLRISQNLVLANQFIEEQVTEAEMEVRQYEKLRFGSSEDVYTLPGKKFRWKRNVDAYRDESIEDETKLNRLQIDMVWNDGPKRTNDVRVETIMVNREKEKTQN